jgi:NTP pyrophosphatase (non-canonical NTP hydrolase)
MTSLKDMARGLYQIPPLPNLSYMFRYYTIQQIVESCREDSLAWFPDTADNLFFQAACAAGEAGEMLNEAKKLFRSVDENTPERRKKLEEESIDVLIYLANVWAILGTDVRKVYGDKRAANQLRFGGAGPAGESGPGRGVPDEA